MGLVASAAALFLPIAYGERFAAHFWAPKAAILLIAGAVGLTMLPSLLRSDARNVALAAVALLGVAGLATALSDEPIYSLVGRYNQGTGFVFLAACAGMWALGARTQPADRMLLVGALLVGIGISSAMAVLQTYDLVSTTALHVEGRASGLAGNAVHLAAQLTAACAVAVHRARRRVAWIAGAGASAGVVQLTGTRFALAVVLALALAGAVRLGWRRGVLLIAAVALGVGAGSWIGGSQDIASATERSKTDSESGDISGGGTRVRWDVWSVGVQAFERRPLLGHGPGRFRAATVSHQTMRVAQLEGGDVAYTDAHNIVVEHLVTVGALGALALATWVALLLRRARGELAWAAVALGAMALVQLMNVATTPFVFLLLGAAGPAVLRARKTFAAPKAMVVIAAATAAAALMIGDLELRRGYREGDARVTRTADRLLRPWPEPATMHAAVAEESALRNEGSFDAAISWRREAIRRDRRNPQLWRLLAQTELFAGDTSGAERDFLRALELNPWSTASMRALALMAEAAGNSEAAERYALRALRIRPDRELDELLDRLAS